MQGAMPTFKLGRSVMRVLSNLPGQVRSARQVTEMTCVAARTRCKEKSVNMQC